MSDNIKQKKGNRSTMNRLKRFVSLLTLTGIFTLTGCKSSDITPTPVPTETIVLQDQDQQGVGCPNGKPTFVPGVREPIIPVDFSAARANNLTGDQRIEAIQNALDHATENVCVASGCCIDPWDLVPVNDHGANTVVLGDGPHFIFWVGTNRRGATIHRGQTNWKFKVQKTNGFANMDELRAQTLGQITYPDDAGPDMSLWSTMPFYAMQLAGWNGSTPVSVEIWLFWDGR